MILSLYLEKSKRLDISGRVQVLVILLLGDLRVDNEPFPKAYEAMNVVDLAEFWLLSNRYEPMDDFRIAGFECGQALLGPTVFVA